MNQAIKTRIEEINSGKVPSGYKKTKVGIVPVEWEEKNLSAILARQTTKNRGNSIHNVLTNSATQGIISQQDYFDKQIANNENTDGYYIVKQGYFVYNPRISVSAPCGPFNKYYGEDDGIISPLYTVYKYVDDSAAYSDFLAYLFSSTIWHGYMHSIANYGARSDRMSVTNEDIDNMPLPYPSIKEQERIAEILKTQDRVIELKEKLLKEKQREKKYLMQQLLTGKIRLKGFTDGWKKYEFTDIFITLNYRDKQIPKTDYLRKGKYPIIDQGKQLIIGFSNDLSKIIKCPSKGIIIFGDHTREIKFYNNDFCLGGDGTQLLVCKQGFIERYLYFYLLNRKIYSDGYNRHFKYIREFIYKLPMEKEQLAVVDIFSTKDKEIDLIKQEIDNEKQKKKALMQLLLSGIVRVG